MVGCSSGWWVTASREQYWPVGPCHRSSSAAACASMSGSSSPRSAPSDRERAVGGGEERVEPDVLDQHRPGRAACAGGRSRSAGRGSRARACAARRRRTPARSRGGSGCRSGASAAGAPGAGARRRAATTASAIAAQRVHPRRGGVEPALPGVDEGDQREPSSRRSRSSQRVVGDELRHHLVDERAPVVGAEQRRRPAPTAIAATRRLGDAGGGDVARRVRVAARLPDAAAADVLRCPRRRSCAAASRCPTGRGTARAAPRRRGRGRSGRSRWR